MSLNLQMPGVKACCIHLVRQTLLEIYCNGIELCYSKQVLLVQVDMAVTEKAVDCLRILTTGNEANKVALLTSASGLPCLVRLMEKSPDQASLLHRPALPCPALPCPALPCPALPCPALPCPALPCPALPCPALPCPAYVKITHQTAVNNQLLLTPVS